MARRDVYKQFQKALVEARQQQGLTQAEVAGLLGKPQSFVSKYESGERRLDVVEFLDLCKTLKIWPTRIFNKLGLDIKEKDTILTKWGITEVELTDLVEQNPSLRGIMLGYVAEKKFHDLFLNNAAITETTKDDDHDRKKKGDRRIIYKGKTLIIEVKSLQTNMVQKIGEDDWVGRTQVDGSDRRDVTLPDGSTLNTTLLVRGEFDLLAVNCFAFGEKWRFAFVKNSDLPCSASKKYTEYQRKQLIASLIALTWPPKPPFTDNLFDLLNELAKSKK